MVNIVVDKRGLSVSRTICPVSTYTVSILRNGTNWAGGCRPLLSTTSVHPKVYFINSASDLSILNYRTNEVGLQEKWGLIYCGATKIEFKYGVRSVSGLHCH